MAESTIIDELNAGKKHHVDDVEDDARQVGVILVIESIDISLIVSSLKQQYYLDYLRF